MMISTKPRHPGRPKQSADMAAARQEDILLVATTIFAKLGYQNTDVQLVADKLGIGKGTIYRSFATKQDLFLAAVDRGLRRLKERMTEDTKDITDPIAYMKEKIRSYLAFFDENSELVELFIQERAEFKERPNQTYFENRKQSMEIWRSFVDKLIQAGLVRDMPADRVTDVISQLLYGTIFLHYSSEKDKTLQQRAEDIIDVFFGGILTNEALAKHLQGR